MENKTIIGTVAGVVAAGALSATLMLTPLTSDTTTSIEASPTPTATMQATASPTATPMVTVAPSQTPQNVVVATPTPTKTPSPTTTPQSPSAPTLEDYAIRTVLEDGTVIVSYPDDMPAELVTQLMPKKKHSK